MRFQHVKGEELEGPIKLSGFEDWAKELENGSRVNSILLVSAPGRGKGAAVGLLAERLQYEVVRCRLPQLLEYPNPVNEFRTMLQGSTHLKRTVLWLDGLDRVLEKLSNDKDSAPQILVNWLRKEADELRHNEVVVVATARERNSAVHSVLDAFDRNFAAE